MKGKYMTKKDYIKFADLLTSWKLKGYVNQEGVFFNIISDLNTLFKELICKHSYPTQTLKNQLPVWITKD